MVPRTRPPLKVLITVDTEVWPHTTGWREESLEGDVQRDIYGITEDGEFGLAFQCGMLSDHHLKAIFFVEGLFASVVGMNPLREIVKTVSKHDGLAMELHAHAEWARYLSLQDVNGDTKLQHFHQLPFEQQVFLLDLAYSNLRSAGVQNIRSFRAGNSGANLETCRALAAVGLPFDFSYNAAFLGEWCKIDLPELLFQPAPLGGITEYPTSCFGDYPGHLRPAQLCACSFQEMKYALIQAWQSGWGYFVILSHSFELIKGRNRVGGKARVNRTALDRMERLCRFLNENTDRFQTVTCESLDVLSAGTQPAAALRGSLLNTATRCCEQAWLRLT
jgi:hypothetical protein